LIDFPVIYTDETTTIQRVMAYIQLERLLASQEQREQREQREHVKILFLILK
jgi:hypothetical protein